MIRSKLPQAQTWSRTLQVGAAAGIAITFIYASIFALYAIFRSSLTIWALTPADISLFGTLVANAASITLSSLATAAVLSLLTALFGMGTAVVIKWLDGFLNSNHNSQRAMMIGFRSSLGFVLLFQIAMQILLKDLMPGFGVETYLFWFGLPGLLNIGAGAVGAICLNRLIANNHIDSVDRTEANDVNPRVYSSAG